MSLLSLAVDSSNDLTLGADGNLATTQDLAAVMQAAGHAARTLLGEMAYATDVGIPFFDVVWNGTPNVPQFEAYLRRALLSVDGVVQVVSVAITTAGNVLSYVATLQTVYGEGTLNG